MRLVVALFGNLAGLVGEPINLALAELPLIAQGKLELLLGQAGGEATHDKLEARLLRAIGGGAGRTVGVGLGGIFLQGGGRHGQHAVGARLGGVGRRRHCGRAGARGGVLVSRKSVGRRAGLRPYDIGAAFAWAQVHMRWRLGPAAAPAAQARALAASGP